MISKKRMIPAAVIAMAGLMLTACGSSTEAAGDAGSDVEAVVDAPKTISEGELTVCASFGNPPNAYYTESHEETGAETDIARALGPLMGLQTKFVETKFASVIPTLQAGQCDVIMSSLYIKPEREEVVDFVPYMMSGQAVVVSKDNPKGITGYDDTMCGNKIGFQVSTTAEVAVNEQGKKCEEAGKPAISVVKTEEGTMGMQQVQTGQIDAYVDTQSAAIYTAGKSNGSLQVTGDPFGMIEIGAAVKKGNTELKDAISTALDALIESGEYTNILKKYKTEDMAIEDAK
ncbi:ABC transporter substrate-binding protein [Brevibacterium sp.]|uniref:ABC transporter substrate-binding protein n=1 Tax=Brevibacterium sp. TaxID=1701 RepID=UPI0028114B0B|nr:ABC transporter substrate-binding protein [Brevibacterium sp.]